MPLRKWDKLHMATHNDIMIITAGVSYQTYITMSRPSDEHIVALLSKTEQQEFPIISLETRSGSTW